MGPEFQFLTIYVTNIVSIVATLSVLLSYPVFRRRYPVAMSRSTLVISVCIAFSDLFEHAFNFAGYNTYLPGIACPLIGGFFFAVPLLCTLFYSCSVALNCLCVFVFRIQQKVWLQWLYLVGPPVASIGIGLGTLLSHSFGYDTGAEYCWYTTIGVSQELLGLRELLTFYIPMFFCIAFLFISVPIILYVLFRPHKPEHQTLSGTPPASPTAPYSPPTAKTDRNLARRALLLRLIGYMFVPFICYLPMAIINIITVLGGRTTYAAATLAIGLSGLLGTFNAILYWLDPTVLAIFSAWRQNRRKRHADSMKTPDRSVASLRRESEETSVEKGPEVKSLQCEVTILVQVDIVEEVASKISDL